MEGATAKPTVPAPGQRHGGGAPSLIDTHSHIDLDAFDEDRTAVLDAARAAGVHRQVVPAIARGAWPKLAALCVRHRGLFAAYGLHPMFLDRHRPSDLEALDAWLDHHPAVAVGECGLDFHLEDSDRRAQRRYFAAQLEIAHARGLPVIVHARKAVEEVVRTVRGLRGLRGVVHSYSGSREQAQQLWDAGFMIGIGGPVTYARARRLRALVATMPIEHLLLETDAPDQPLCGRQGQRNEPARLSEVLEVVAALRGVRAAQVAAATTANAQRLFGLVGVDQ